MNEINITSDTTIGEVIDFLESDDGSNGMYVARLCEDVIRGTECQLWVLPKSMSVLNNVRTLRITIEEQLVLYLRYQCKYDVEVPESVQLNPQDTVEIYNMSGFIVDKYPAHKKANCITPGSITTLIPYPLLTVQDLWNNALVEAGHIRSDCTSVYVHCLDCGSRRWVSLRPDIAKMLIDSEFRPDTILVQPDLYLTDKLMMISRKCEEHCQLIQLPTDDDTGTNVENISTPTEFIDTSSM